MSDSSAIRIAIIGCGGIGAVHALAIAAWPQRMRLVAGADITLEKASELTQKFTGNPYDDYRTMITQEKPDLIIVCTWPNLHEEQVLESIRLGTHAILCEKSLSMNAASAARMAHAAQQARCMLVESFMGRHTPRTLELKRLVDTGRIGSVGKITATFQRPALAGKVNWKHNPALGGVAFDFTCYCVNAMGLFTTELPTKVSAFLDQREDGLNTQLHGMLTYRNGLVGVIESSYYNAFRQDLEVHGDQGILRLNNAWVGTGEEGIELINGLKSELIPTPAIHRAQAQLLHLCDCIQNASPPRFTLEESVRNHCVIDALLESARTGSSVQPRLP